jgi:hypothetical protein
VFPLVVTPSRYESMRGAKTLVGKGDTKCIQEQCTICATQATSAIVPCINEATALFLINMCNHCHCPPSPQFDICFSNFYVLSRGQQFELPSLGWNCFHFCPDTPATGPQISMSRGTMPAAPLERTEVHALRTCHRRQSVS